MITLFLTLAFVFMVDASPENKTDIIEGVVRDRHKTPIQGVEVKIVPIESILTQNKLVYGEYFMVDELVKDTFIYKTTTDYEGKYTFTVPDTLKRFAITYWFIGYERTIKKIDRTNEQE
ncbi:MAG: hypothetical protein ACLFNU_10135 [Bacteroidales bacterium]